MTTSIFDLTWRNGRGTWRHWSSWRRHGVGPGGGRMRKWQSSVAAKNGAWHGSGKLKRRVARPFFNRPMLWMRIIDRGTRCNHRQAGIGQDSGGGSGWKSPRRHIAAGQRFLQTVAGRLERGVRSESGRRMRCCRLRCLAKRCWLRKRAASSISLRWRA